MDVEDPPKYLVSVVVEDIVLRWLLAEMGWCWESGSWWSGVVGKYIVEGRGKGKDVGILLCSRVLQQESGRMGICHICNITAP